jgi:hypothetical protein
MAIGYDASSESHTGTTGSASETSFSWTHTPAGTPKGVLIFTFVNANADDATAVTYGGVSLTDVSGGRAVDTAGEPGDCKAWFLGSGVPTGSQTVTVTRNNNANVMYAVAITVTSSQDSAVHTGTGGIVLIQGDTALIEQAVTDGSSGTGNSMRFAAVNSGCDQFSTTPIKPDGITLAPYDVDSTWVHGIDFGTRVCGVVRETTAGTGSRSVGFLSPTEDTAAVHLAIKDIVAGAVTVVKDLINGFGIIPFKR